MPRPAKPARLYLRAAERGERVATWWIVDRGRRYPTGCGEAARAEAEKRLADYLGDKHEPQAFRPGRPNQTHVVDVLSIYMDDVVPRLARPKKVAERIDRLIDYWDGKTLADVTPASCRQYTLREIPTISRGGKIVIRKGAGGARRDLEDLRAAINHHAKRGLHTGLVLVELPDRGARRERWLTRSEAARLLWICWRHREVQEISRGRHKGELQATDKRPLRHLARFLLMALYTGSRSGAILTASIHAGAGRSFVDLESGIFYRLAEGARETNKRQPPAPIPAPLLAHLRRWRDRGAIASYVVEWQGMPVRSIKVGWASAVRLSKLEGKITPHTLRHTAATWLRLNHVPTALAASYLGMSEQIYIATYAKEDLEYLRGASRAIHRKRPT